MTNAMIILDESVRLMNEGVLAGTGEFVTIENEDGTKRQLEMPEAIHTFNGWKERGYAVKKGEKAIAKFTIWKCKNKKVETEEGEALTLDKKQVASIHAIDQWDEDEA